MHVNMGYTASNTPRLTPATAKGIPHVMVTNKQKRNSPRYSRIFKDDLATVFGIIMKDRCIIITKELQVQVLGQLQNNHMGIKKQGY